MRFGRNAVVGAATAVAVGMAMVVAALPAAAASAPPVSSVDFTFTFSVTQAGGTTLTGNGNGQADFATDQLEVTVDLPGGLAPLLSALPSSLAAMTKGAAADTQFQVVVSGGTVFVELPGLTVGGKSTVGVSLPSAVVATAFDGIAGDLANGSDLLAAVKARPHHERALGRRVLGGVKSTGRSATVPNAHMLALLHGFGSSIGPSISGQVGSTLPIKVWTNPQGQVNEISVDASWPHAKGGPSAVNGAIKFTGYDSPVTVTAPASGTSLTLSWTTVVKMFLGSGASGGSWSTGAARLTAPKG